MVPPRAHLGSRARAAHFRFPNKRRCEILWASCRNNAIAALCKRRPPAATRSDSRCASHSEAATTKALSKVMRTFGGFRSGEEFFYGEVCGEDVHVLAKPYWIEITPTGDMRKLADLHVDLPVAPSKLIAVGLNYSDH